MLLEGNYRISPVDEDSVHQIEKKKKRDGLVRARHL